MVLARVLLMTCVCAALSQTSQALTCYGCSLEDYGSQTGCDTSQTCETDGACHKSTTKGLGSVIHSCWPAASTGCTTSDAGPYKTTICFCVTHLCNGSGGSEDQPGSGSEDQPGGGSEDQPGGGSEDQPGGGSTDQPGGESGAQSPCRAFSLLLPAVAAVVAAVMVTSQ